MHFFTAALLSAVAIGSTAAQLCPVANHLFYQGASSKLYQIQCDVEYWTRTNLASSVIANPIACAGACDLWTTANPTKPCVAGSWQKSTSVCYLKPGDLNAERRNNTDVISLIYMVPV